MSDIFLHCEVVVRLFQLNLHIPEMYKTIVQKKMDSDMSYHDEETSIRVEVKRDDYFMLTCMCQCPHVGKFFGFLCISEGSPTCTMTAIPISAWKFMWQWKSQKPVKFIIV